LAVTDKKSATGRSVLTAPEPARDPEVMESALAVFEQPDRGELFRVLLAQTAEWCGATCGFALARNKTRRRMSPLASTLPENDTRHRAVGRLDVQTISRITGQAPQVFDGWGPLAHELRRWPGPAPAHGVTFPVLDTEQGWAGLLLLAFDEVPSAAGLARAGALVELIRPAISHVQQIEGLRELVIKDDTAHCFNRRHFEDFLPDEISRASRFRAPLSLIFLDMDNLKAVNNEHGHAIGSRTLTEVSARIRRKIRRFDKLFRFGGDEFCIVLPETEWHGAMEVAERVRQAISGRPLLQHELPSAGGVEMTASLGIASFPLHALCRQELIEKADRAMQAVKKAAKDGVMVAEITGDDNGD